MTTVPRPWVKATFVGVALMLGACNRKPRLKQAEKDEDRDKQTLREQIESLRGVSGTVDAPVMTLETGVICSELSVTGELIPRRSVIVKPSMEGRIAFQRPIRVGDKVREDELIAKIDDRDIEDEIKQQEQQIAIAREKIKLDQNELEQKQKDVEFDREMVREGFLNQSELRKSESLVSHAEISLRQSRLVLEQEENKLKRVQRKREKVPITAPIGGMVVLASHLTGQKGASDLLNEEIMSQEDTLVNTGTQLFGIVSRDEYLAQCLVNGKDKAKLRVEQPACVTVISHRAVEVKGSVARIAHLQEAKTHAYKVWLQLDEMHESFTSGLFVRARVELGRSEDTVVVPKSYVKERDGRPFVQLVRDGKIEDVWVTLGLKQTGDIELASGVAAGEQLIASEEVFKVAQAVTPVEIRAD